MKALDHDTVFGKICAKFDTYTKSGRLSQTKSRNIFNFFCALELHGSDELKKKYSKSQYYQYISDLMSCGFSKAYLQNLDSESKITLFHSFSSSKSIFRIKYQIGIKNLNRALLR